MKKHGMSFDDILTRVGCGPWNWFVFLLSSSWGLLASLQALASAFLAPDVDHRCDIPETQSYNWTKQQIEEFSFPKIKDVFSKCLMFKHNYSEYMEQSYEQATQNIDFSTVETVKCSSWRYDKSIFQSTVISEWNLVCDRQFMGPLVQSTFMLGFLIGAPIGGLLADRFGRKKVIMFGFYLCAALSFMATYAPYFELFLVLRFLMAVTGYCVYQTSYILVIECTSLAHRGIAGLAFCIPFAFGYMLLPGIAYLVRDWRQLHLTLSIMIVPLIGNTLLLPESPRWLLFMGKPNSADKVIQKALKWNGKLIEEREEVRNISKHITQTIKCEEDVEAEKKNSSSMCPRILGSARLIKYCVILSFIWFTSTMVYYGLSLNSANFNADPYLYMFFGGLVELPCYTIIVPIIVMFGRRVSLSSLFCVCGVFLIIPLLLPGDKTAWWFVALNLLAKLCITTAFQMIFLYSSEVFPTNVRTQGVGITNLVGRGGATISPFITGILGHHYWALPSIIFAITSICSGLVIFALPETKGKPLPDMEADVDLLESSPQKSSECSVQDEASEDLIEDSSVSQRKNSGTPNC